MLHTARYIVGAYRSSPGLGTRATKCSLHPTKHLQHTAHFVPAFVSVTADFVQLHVIRRKIDNWTCSKLYNTNAKEHTVHPPMCVEDINTCKCTYIYIYISYMLYIDSQMNSYIILFP